jgi:hypothetical protein
VARKAKKEKVMRNLTWKTGILMAISGIALLSVTTAYAQPLAVRANIPFQFLAGDKVLPAGQYQLSVAPGLNRITLHPTQGGTGVYLSIIPTQRSEYAAQPGALVFHRYGTHYFLRKVWSPGQSGGYALPSSKAEREFVRIAKTPAATETVSLGAGPE